MISLKKHGSRIFKTMLTKKRKRDETEIANKVLSKILPIRAKIVVQSTLDTKYEAFNANKAQTGAIIQRKRRMQKYRFRLPTLDWMDVIFLHGFTEDRTSFVFCV